MTRIITKMETRNVGRLKARRNGLKAQELEKMADAVKCVPAIQ